MAFERADVYEVTQFGVESVLLTAVPATKRATQVSVTNQIMIETSTHRSRGSRFTNVAIGNKEWTEADWQADVATYTEPAYAVAAAFGSPDIATPIGGTLTRDWTTQIRAFSGANPKSLTLESANFVRAGKSAGHTIDNIAFDFTRDGVSWNAHSFGGVLTDAITPTPGTNETQTITITGTPTGGTFTLTFMGETTGTIAFDATSAAVVTALEALPNIGAGGVTATGGALPGTPVVVTFKLQWASQNVPMMVDNDAGLTGGTAPAVAITESAAGAPLTELSNIPVAGNQWNLYVDTSAAGLGGTKLPRALEVSWSMSGLWGPLWVGNTANPSWVNVVPLAPDTEFRMLIEADATGMSYLTQLRAGTRIFPRIEAIGQLIEGSLYHRWLHDFCVLLTDVTPFGESQGIVTTEYSGVLAHDSTWDRVGNISQRWTGTAL